MRGIHEVKTQSMTGSPIISVGWIFIVGSLTFAVILSSLPVFQR